MNSEIAQPYLLPYVRATELHGDSFRSLLWASPFTQRLRFAAICRAIDLNGVSMLDAGCGLADLLDYLLSRGVRPQEYIGLEAVEELASWAAERNLPGAKIIRADFLEQPVRLFAGADVVIFSGSLNTLRASDFYAAIRDGYEAAGSSLVFNFLCSPALAGRDYLTWHEISDVTKFLRRLGAQVLVIEDYLQGDCTVLAAKTHSGRAAARQMFHEKGSEC